VQDSIFGANLLLGYLTGARAELTLFNDGNRSYVAEAFYGAVITRMGSSEGAGVGGRVLFLRSSRYNTNALLLGPGLDVFAQFKNDNMVWLAPTVDVSWVHGFVGGAGWETGLNLGIGAAVSSKKNNDDRHAGDVTPLISFYTGLRY
jgi:hypothetical protein